MMDKPKSEARRQFLGGTARAGLAALAGPLFAAPFGKAYGGDIRTYVGTQYGFELDGIFAGFVWNPSGGNVVADLVAEKAGADSVQRKRLGARRIEPITIETGLPMPRGFYEWIKSSIEPRPKFPRRNGAILLLDHDGKERSRRSFSNALITSVQFPPCDGRLKEASRLKVTFAPEATALSFGKSTVPLHAIQAQKRFLLSNYKLRIKGLESATAMTSRIEPLTIRVTTLSTKIGERRDYDVPPGMIDVGNLVVTVDEAHLPPLYAWYDDFVVKGNSGPDRELVGVLEYMTPDMKSPWLVLNLFNLGVFRITPEQVSPTDPNPVARSKVEMYCQTVTADFMAS